jgi:acyl-CoA reductase-like NAD-dependent aldehyde dehydrogenase
MREFAMSIDGTAVAAQQTFGVIDPATGEAFADAPECTREQLDDAMAAAAAAHDWGQDDQVRVAVLGRAADAVAAAQDELAPILAREQGKPLQAAAFEVAETARWLRASADLAVPLEVIQDDERGYATVERRPLGVVAAITPWNFPLLLTGWKLGPALRAGNTVVLKPSPFTPLSSLALGEVLNQTLPPGVVNVVSGSDELGGWMTGHPLVRKISFTGSVATGKRIAAAAAPDLKRYTLELGGNDAAIVLPDADVARIGRRLFWGAFINNGQICAGIKRILVPESLHDELVEVLAEWAGRVRVGAWDEPRAQLGPVNNAPQFERVSGLVEDAVGRGAKVAAGGAPLPRPASSMRSSSARRCRSWPTAPSPRRSSGPTPPVSGCLARCGERTPTRRPRWRPSSTAEWCSSTTTSPSSPICRSAGSSGAGPAWRTARGDWRSSARCGPSTGPGANHAATRPGRRAAGSSRSGWSAVARDAATSCSVPRSGPVAIRRAPAGRPGR